MSDHDMMTMEQARAQARHRILTLEARVHEAESTTATLRRAVDVLSAKLGGAK